MWYSPHTLSSHYSNKKTVFCLLISCWTLSTLVLDISVCFSTHLKFVISQAPSVRYTSLTYYLDIIFIPHMYIFEPPLHRTSHLSQSLKCTPVYTGPICKPVSFLFPHVPPMPSMVSLLPKCRDSKSEVLP